MMEDGGVACPVPEDEVRVIVHVLDAHFSACRMHGFVDIGRASWFSVLHCWEDATEGDRRSS